MCVSVRTFRGCRELKGLPPSAALCPEPSLELASGRGLQVYVLLLRLRSLLLGLGPSGRVDSAGSLSSLPLSPPSFLSLSSLPLFPPSFSLNPRTGIPEALTL